MNTELLESLVVSRAMIGYLGEKGQYGWWQCAFFSQGSSAFLSPLYSRTQVLAQCNGVTRAAALVHDERIGVGHVYHLFRLPEDMEQGIHQVLHQEILAQQIQGIVSSRETAIAQLGKLAAKAESTSPGPTRIGNVDALWDRKLWGRVVGCYLAAFESGQEVFPYFTDAE